MSSDSFTPTPSIGAGLDATVVMPDGSSVPYVRPQGSSNPLPLAYRIDKFEIIGLIGEGGFGIVYLARHTDLGHKVALKEYMPAALAVRGPGHEVRVQSERQRDTFELGRRSFLNEARLLTAFDHPSLVKVNHYFEGNGTAYMVMPFYEGPTVKQWLIEHGSPSEDWLLALLSPLMDALETMHQSHCYHRDIAPDNILLLSKRATQVGAAPTMRPVLLDFGAARQVIGDASQVLTVILKPGYAPIEQYAESASMKQGAWTDVYALCAVLYAAVAGRAPNPSVARVLHDDLVPAAKAGEGRYSPGFLAVIDQGLAVRPDQRPQDMGRLRQLFQAALPANEQPLLAPRQPPVEPEAAPAVFPGDAAAAPASSQERPSPTPAASAAMPGTTATQGLKTSSSPAVPRAVPPGPASLSAPDPEGESLSVPDEPLPLAEEGDASRLTKMMAAAGVALVLVAGGTWWGLESQRPRPKPVEVAVDPLARQDGAASAVPAGTTLPAASSAEKTGFRPPAVAASGPSAVLASAKPFQVVEALEDIVKNADPLMGVNMLSDHSRLVIGKDRLQFRVKSSESGYLYVFLSGTDKSHFYLLFPNGLDKDNRLTANKEVSLPRRNWRITAAGPAGTNHIVAVVSKHPRDLSGAGLLQRREDVIQEFDIGRAQQLWMAREEGRSPFMGVPRCEGEGGAACDGTYGATLLTIDEVGDARP